MYAVQVLVGFSAVDRTPETLPLTAKRLGPSAVATRAATVVVAEEILQTADREAALIVSGGNGHSRMREWIFGGVTRDLIQTAPMCCLMSH